MKKSIIHAGACALSLLYGCGSSNAPIAGSSIGTGSVSTTPGTATSSPLATEIPVTRAQCTPFGNPPRPRNDMLTDTMEANTQCVGGGTRLPDFPDNNGTTRRACLYDPGTATPTHKLPLVVFLQGSAVPSDVQLVPSTNVLDGLATADLTGDPARPGFILVESIGRVTDHFYPAPNDTNTVGYDVWYRQFAPAARVVDGQSYPTNADAMSIDKLIADQLASGRIDPDRIYILGWSNGAALSLLYGQSRPGVAAVAMYSGPDPYDSLTDTCGQQPTRAAPLDDTQLQVANPAIPVLHIHNNCDIYSTCPNALALHDRLSASRTASLADVIIDGLPLQEVTTACDSACGTDPRGDGGNAKGQALGLNNHLQWPKNSTADYFLFLRDHPLSARR